jgi:hypothetical protein
VDLVSSLVKKYIGGDTLILLTISMKGTDEPELHLLSSCSNMNLDDFANQGAATMAGEVDSGGSRTIGKDALIPRFVLDSQLNRRSHKARYCRYLRGIM